MRSRTYYRVRLAVRLALALSLIALIVWISGHVWYVPGKGYCIGTMLECYAETFTR